MVNAGLIPMIVMDRHKAEFWDHIFDGIDVREDLAVNTGGEIAWAMRKDSPKLKQEINAFVKGLNPNAWFRNVEVIAAREIGRETVQFVSDIYKYYVAYRLIVEVMKSKSETKAKMISDQEP